MERAQSCALEKASAFLLLFSSLSIFSFHDDNCASNGIGLSRRINSDIDATTARIYRAEIDGDLIVLAAWYITVSHKIWPDCVRKFIFRSIFLTRRSIRRGKLDSAVRLCVHCTIIVGFLFSINMPLKGTLYRVYTYVTCNRDSIC